MSFKDFCKNNEKHGFNKGNINENETKKVEELYDKYKDKDENELLNELFKNVELQKKNGTFNYNSLISTIEKISPFLTNEQNLKIKDLLNKIK